MNITRTLRGASWLAVAGLLGAALIAPSGALAETGNQTNVAWDSQASDCTGAPGGGNFTPGPGEVIWVFVHSQVDGPGTLTANFDVAGQKTADSYVQGGIKYAISTGHDTLLSFSDNLEGGVLTLSHVCYETTTTTTTTSSSSTSTTISETTSTSTTISETTSVSTTTSTTGTGSVEAETGTPRATPPATDALTTSGPSNDSWRMVLLGFAGLLTTILILTPATAARRSKR